MAPAVGIHDPLGTCSSFGYKTTKLDCQVHLAFSKLLKKLVVKNVSTYTKGHTTLKKDQRRTYQMMLMQCSVLFVFLNKRIIMLWVLI